MKLSELCLNICLLVVCVSKIKACTDGKVQITGGPNELEGRLEYCNSSTWGHVCGEGWDLDAALVVCRQLGFASTTAVWLASTRLYYGASEGNAFLNNINCVTGDEETLEACEKNNINETGCSDLGGYAYILCQDASCEGSEADRVRLVDGPSDSTSVGRVEVCDGEGYRRQVCQEGWDNQDATVVCRNLGFQNGQGAMFSTGYQVTNARLPSYNNVGCSGTEQWFANCSRDTVVTFTTNRCPGFAGVMCLDPVSSSPTLSPSFSVITTAHVPAAVTSTVTSSPITTTPSPSFSTTMSTHVPAIVTSKVTSSPITTTSSQQSPSTLTNQPLSSPNPSTTPTAVTPRPPGEADNILLIAVVGGVGGAVVLLLLLLVVLFMLILFKRSRTAAQYKVSTSESNVTPNSTPTFSHNGLQLPPIPMEELVSSVKEPESYHKRPRSSSDYDHVLLNPLYGPKRSRSNTMVSDRSSVSDPGYAEIKGMARRRSPLHFTLQDSRDSVPSDTSGNSTKSLSPVVLSKQGHNHSGLLMGSNSDLHTRPYRDGEGYAELDGEQHVYDEMTTHMYDDINQLSKSMRNTIVPINELLLSASPYETPAIPAYTTAKSDVLRGSLLSPSHKFGGARSNPNQSETTQRGFNIPPPRGFLSANPGAHFEGPEYKELEAENHWYDSPRSASTRGYEAPVVTTDEESARMYEDPIMTKDVGAAARGYENPVITVTTEHASGADKPGQSAVDRNLDTIPEYDTLESLDQQS